MVRYTIISRYDLAVDLLGVGHEKRLMLHTHARISIESFFFFFIINVVI